MKKKSKLALFISIFVILIAIILIVVILLKSQQELKKRKETAIKDTSSLVDELTSICMQEKETEKITRRYVVEDGKIDVDVKTTLPSSAIIEFDLECNSSMYAVYDGFTLTKNELEETKLVETTNINKGQVIYYDAVNNKVCNNYTEENSKTGIYDCMKWYVMNDDDVTVNIILDHNIEATKRYILDGEIDSLKNNEEANTIVKELDNLTTNWLIKPRLLTLSDLEKVLDVKITNTSEGLFFDSKLKDPLKECYKGDTSKCSYSWLYDRTSTDCEDYGCFANSDLITYGYWLYDMNEDSERAYRVYKDGRIIPTKVNDVLTGIRPVTTISKILLEGKNE